ncbi:hypothetical protein MKW92_006084 [Papaver armeniacum]|nr:hypothetical protein MKW92_006084 [Papaver armeniacum]
MGFLNNLLNIHQGFDYESWLKQCRKQMVDTFQEDLISLLISLRFDINTRQRQGPSRLPLEASDDLFTEDIFCQRGRCLIAKSSPIRKKQRLQKDLMQNHCK